MHADGFELLAPRIGDGLFAALGEHDRRAVGGVQRKQLQPWCDFRRSREQARDILRADALHVSDLAVSELRQRFWGHQVDRDLIIHIAYIAVHGPRLLSVCRSSPFGSSLFGPCLFGWPKSWLAQVL